MGRKALEVGVVSRAAAIVFERIRTEKGLSKKEVFLGVKISSSSRYQALIKGTQVWMLDDVGTFAAFLEVPLKTAFMEIDKEVDFLTQVSECSCVNTGDSLAS